MFLFVVRDFLITGRVRDKVKYDFEFQSSFLLRSHIFDQLSTTQLVLDQDALESVRFEQLSDFDTLLKKTI